MKDSLKRFCTATASTLMIVATFVTASPVKTDAASTFKKLFKDYTDKKTVKTVAGHKVRNGNGNLDIMYSDEKFWRPSSVNNYSPVFSDGTDIYYTDNQQLMKFNFELYKGETVFDLAHRDGATNISNSTGYNIAAYNKNKFYINEINYENGYKIISYDIETGETSEIEGAVDDYKGDYLLIDEFYQTYPDNKGYNYLCKFTDDGITKLKKISKYGTGMMSYSGKNFYFLEIRDKKNRIFLKTCKPDGSGMKTLKKFKMGKSGYSLTYKYNKKNLTFTLDHVSYKLTYKNNKVVKTK